MSDHEEALGYCEQAIALLLEELGDRHRQAHAWDSLGYAHQHLGHSQQAINSYQRALALFASLGDNHSEADTLTHLGDAQAAAGDHDGARRTWRRALAILDELAHPDADDVRAKLR